MCHQSYNMYGCCCCRLCGPLTCCWSFCGGCIGIGRCEAGFGCAARRLAASCPARDALTLARRKIGLVDKPMLAKRSSWESGLAFLGAVFWTSFLLPRIVILLIGLSFPPREFLVKVACSVSPTYRVGVIPLLQ
jgi:hypothetical protein